MNIKDIVLIIPNFNQYTYLVNLINQFRFYYPENPVVIIDNGSDYLPLIEYYAAIDDRGNIFYELNEHNDFVKNLTEYIDKSKHEYYIVSDPDLSIPPTTPPNFIEFFKAAIDVYGFHHAGFGLKTDDIPSWNPKAGWIQGDEKALLGNPVEIEHEGAKHTGYRSPIDTTFCLYKRDNGGWQAPMSGEAWSNALRLFEIVHLPWYLHKDYLNEEMKHYFATCKKRDNSLPSAGRNHYNPFNGIE